MNRFLPTSNLAILVAIAAMGASAFSQEELQPVQGERLVPAALGIRTDKRGNSWNVEQNGTIGRIGSTMVNSGLALMIDDEKFVSFQPMMTEDGGEFILQGRPMESYPGLQVQRRIRLMEEAGGLRYAEMFYNGSTDPISINVGLATNFSGNYKTFLTDRGRTEPVILDESETGIVVLPGSSQSTKAYLFTLGGPNAALKPSISAQNRYGLEFRYRLELAPGETSVLVHNVAQVVIPQNFDRRTLLKLFSPLSFSETSGYISAEWSDLIANSRHSIAAAIRSPVAGVVAESLGIEPTSTDVLASGSETRLVGKAEGDGVILSEDFQGATIPLESVAAIEGKDGNPERTPRVFLRDGQVFTSELQTPNLAFTQKNSETVALEPDSLDRLVMAARESETRWSDDGAALIETHGGDRFKVSAGGDLSISAITPWGVLPVTLADLIRIVPGSQQSLGHRVELKDGTDCLALFSEEEIGLTLESVGDYILKTNRLRSIFTPNSQGRKRFSEPGFTDSFAYLSGNQRVAGRIASETVPIVSSGGLIETETSDIRRIERVDSGSTAASGLSLDSHEFRLERWDGGVVNGYIRLESLSYLVRGENWEIPIHDIEKIETASPELTEKVLSDINSLVAQLGADDWATRENATRELGAFGYLARSTLQRELSETNDPEVSRRIERVLAESN